MTVDGGDTPRFENTRHRQPACLRDAPLEHGVPPPDGVREAERQLPVVNDLHVSAAMHEGVAQQLLLDADP